MRRRRIVTLEQVIPEQQHLCKNCFYCIDPKQPSKTVKAVAAVEVEIPHNTNMFFGVCSNHAEISKLSEEWQMENTL